MGALLAIVWAALAQAEPEPAPDVAASPHVAIAAMEQGDAHWFAGRRHRGAVLWRRALRLADGSPQGLAAEAMTRIRLLRAGTTLGAIRHGAALAEALGACPSAEPWCRMAEVDFDLLGNEAWGSDPVRGLAVARLLAHDLPAQAASRQVLATGDVSSLEQIPAAERDGLGRAMTEGFESDPGPVTLGLGFLGGPASGIGAGIHVAHPDVGRREILVVGDAFVATHAYGVSLSAETPGPVGAVVRAVGSRQRWWDLTTETWVPIVEGRVSPGLLLRLGKVRIELGPQVRWDAQLLDGTLQTWAGHGAFGSIALDLRKLHGQVLAGGYARLASEIAVPPLADYDRYGTSGDLRGYLPVGRGQLTGRLWAEAATGDYPVVRLPALGGPYLFRPARAGSLRGRWTSLAAVELRYPVIGPLWLAAFGEGALVGEPVGADVRGTPHGGGGAGLRWVLPPRPYNTVRFDFAAGDTGWQLHVAWGEAW